MNTNTATATTTTTIASLKAKAERAEYRYDELANELDEAQYEAECARNECDEFAEGGRLTEWERELLSDMKREARRLETVARRLAVKLTNAEQAWCKALEALGTAEGRAIVLDVEVIDDSAILEKVELITGATPASIAKAYGWTVEKAERVIVANAKAGNMGATIHSAIEAQAEYDANAEAQAIRAEQIEEALEGYIAQRDANAKAKAQAEAERAEVKNLEREIEATRHTLKEFHRLGEEAFNRYRNTGERAHKDAVLDYIERSANTRDELDALVSRLVELTK